MGPEVRTLNAKRTVAGRNIRKASFADVEIKRANLSKPGRSGVSRETLWLLRSGVAGVTDFRDGHTAFSSDYSCPVPAKDGSLLSASVCGEEQRESHCADGCRSSARPSG